MSSCKEIDALMMDWLYDELDTSQKARFQGHVDGCAHCRAELASLSRARALFADMPEEEPPAALTNILLHEAAKRAQAVPAVNQSGREAGSEGERSGILGWLSGLIRPVMLHPGLAAAASLMLVVGVAGSLYLTGKYQVTEQSVAQSEAPPPAPAQGMPSTEPARLAAPEPAPTTPVAAAQADEDSEGYAADLAGEEMKRELDEVAIRDKADGRYGDQKAKSARTRSDSASLGKGAASGEREMMLSADALLDPMAANTAPGVASGAAGAGSDSRAGMEGGVAAPARSQYAPPPPPRPAEPAPSPEMAKSEAKDMPAPQKASQKASKQASKQAPSTSPMSWAEEREQELLAALRAGRCTEAARIAANLAERSPTHYRSRIAGSKELSRCRTEIAAEQSRRAKAAESKAADIQDTAPADTPTK